MAFQSAAAAAAIYAVPIFSPVPPSPTRRPPTELRFSRWNNAPARDLARRLRPQKEIEDDIRRERRFRSAIAIANDADDDHLPSPPPSSPKSAGTPSSPSRSSIPGRASKYSKPPKAKTLRSLTPSHPAFRPLPRVFDRPATAPEVSVGDAGVSYRVPNAPFEFQYSYTETPKVRPLKLREPPVTPFGPVTMPRPWTGRRPLPGTKKLLPEFDSFRLPPPHKKGVKPVQAPGPFLAGSGPRYVMSREEILGEPLTKDEISDLVRGSLKTRRQLNMGRDGLTHNMLDNIHALWKRRRVCKIKCKGVCTVDMDNVRQQLEDKTGGKIIYCKGGVMFLFRGRNYNYKTRPKYPLMLWKPAAPVYPRLVQRAPEGLTLEEATEMRSKGRKLPVICKLGKNGVYCNLVNNVREAFEECELVRINCQGMNKSDYKKIGAKLKDLVPCVLISFEQEHILMWRGRDWKSSLPMAKDSTHSTANGVVFSLLDESETDDGLETQELTSTKARSALAVDEASTISIPDSVATENAISQHDVVLPYIGTDNQFKEINNGESCGAQADRVVGVNVNHIIDAKSNVSKVPSEEQLHASASNGAAVTEQNEDTLHIIGNNQLLETTGSDFNGMKIDEITRISEDQRKDVSSIVFDVMAENNVDKSTLSNKIHAKGLLFLLQGAIDSGCAVVLEQSDFMDANIVYKRSVDLAKTAPPGPTFRQKTKKLPVNKNKEQDTPKEEARFVFVQPLTSQTSSEKMQSSRRLRNDSFSSDCDGLVRHGSLGIDELAKLLA